MQSLAKKRIAVVGLGLSGLATVRFLLNLGIKPVLMDSRVGGMGFHHHQTALARAIANNTKGIRISVQRCL